MWNYVYYRAYLEFKETTEYNGDESYIRNKMEDNDLSWFPIKRTWSVQQKEDTEIENIQEQVINEVMDIPFLIYFIIPLFSTIKKMKDLNEIAKDTQNKFITKIDKI